MKRFACTVIGLLMISTPALHAQSAADSAAIRGTALDYIEGWYTNDARRVERAVHSQLVKRIVMRGPGGEPEPLSEMSASGLIEGARDDDDDDDDGADAEDGGKRRADVVILDIYENIASVRIDAVEWIDYLHLVRLEDGWKIVNVLWELRPDRGDSAPGSTPPSGPAGHEDAELIGPDLIGPDLISLPHRNEAFPAIDPRNGSLWFSVYDDSFDEQTLMFARWTGAYWAEPEIAPFSGTWGDRAPRFSSDGATLYFTSNRPRRPGESSDDMNIWRVRRSAGTWGDPEIVPGPLNSEANDIHSSVTRRSVWVASRRSGSLGGSDIYRVGGDGAVQHLGSSINDERSQPDLWVSPDESWMILVVTDHPDGYGGDDLFVSRFEGGTWSAPENLGSEINSEQYEYGPTVSPDGVYLYFNSRRRGSADLYRIRLASVPTLANQSIVPYQEAAELDSLYGVFSRAYREGDVDLLMDSVYAVDAYYLPPGSPILYGQESFRQDFAGALDPIAREGGSGPDISFDIRDRGISGDLAYDIGTYTVRSQGEDPGGGKFIVIWKRGADGQWRIHADGYSDLEDDDDDDDDGNDG